MMKKEIGSIYPLYDEDLLCGNETNESSKLYLNNQALFSLCSEALQHVASVNKDCEKRILIPAYTCSVVYDAFLQVDWQCDFYSIDKDLRIDIEHLMIKYQEFRPSIVLVHPYYGMDLNHAEIELLKNLKKMGCKIIVDLTQCVFSKQRLPFVDYYVGSYRKWLNMPDGGFLEPACEMDLSENVSFAQKQQDAMYLRGAYFQTGNLELKNISIRLNKEAEGIVEISRHSILPLSKSIFLSSNIDDIVAKRIKNYSYLYNNINCNSWINKVNDNISNLTTAPLYFPIYAKNRSFVQRLLAENSIYCPVIWTCDNTELLISCSVKYIYEHILAIPIDQRYDTNDMKRIVNILNNIGNEDN